VEAGYCYGEVWTTPRLLRLGAGGEWSSVVEGGRNGPWTGVDHAGGSFFVAEGGVLEGGRILRIERDGRTVALVEGLPSLGDHHTNGPRVRDGWVYFGQGSATNSGVVGEDSASFGWLQRNPGVHDVPGEDIELRGATFESDDVLVGAGRARTGAFARFGDPGSPRVGGQLLCNGAVLRVPVTGGDVERVAWGFRNPFGLAFAPDGGLYATDNGYDDRGSRPVWGAADHLWRVEPGAWYGWPDFSGSRPLTDEDFHPPGGPEVAFVLARHPGQPPEPAAIFGVHSSANGLDFSHGGGFGHAGDAFVALFGDQAPTTGKVLGPVGFKVVRVDLDQGLVHDFLVNGGSRNGPASFLETQGLERPVAVRFDPRGAALYVVDFGVVEQDEAGAHPRPGTGVIWRVERE
jgi:hypothetical protein